MIQRGSQFPYTQASCCCNIRPGAATTEARKFSLTCLDQFCHEFHDILRECIKPPNNDSVERWSLNQAQPRDVQLLQLALEKCLTADRGTDVDGSRISRYKLDRSFVQQTNELKTAADKEPLPAEKFKPRERDITS
jgi:hypothetical protein